jgi:hypothetical protein
MIPVKPQGETLPRRPKQAVSEASASRVTAKPVPKSQVEDARGYQLGQLRRRFSPQETTNDNGDTCLLFPLKPSDPDFPFDLDHLDCDLRVPANYPRGAPELQIRNKNIPRGFAINIERGWEKLVEEKRGATLLALTNALDRKLEELLSAQKSETVKLTIFKDTRHIDQTLVPEDSPAPIIKPPPPRRRYVPEESFSKEQIAEAKARRAQETRQLEARMSRLDLYHKSSDGIVYTLPMEPKRRSELPAGLRSVQSVQLIIPLLYPLQQLRILLNDVESKDAEGIEDLFTKRATEQKQMTLMSHLNYLTQNIHVLAKQVEAEAAAAAAVVGQPPEPDISTGPAQVEDIKGKHISSLDDYKSHIHYISRPPEWDMDDDDHSSEMSDEGEYTPDEDMDEEDGGVAISQELTSSGPTAERGTAILLPAVELRGVELLQISSLNLNIKCSRCKTVSEVGGVKAGAAATGISCRKCGAGMSVGFRGEFVHQHSTRAGFIDAAECSVVNMLPSTFIPTCGSCSTPSAVGLVCAVGDTTTNVCRECHSRFTFGVREVKFLLYAPSLPAASSAAAAAAASGHRRQNHPTVGIHPGTPLPLSGTCAHYRRSHRWFRFGCCGRAYPCDRCHDAAEKDHDVDPDERASRMLCGWCSREQRYHPEMCAFCGRSVIGRRGKGFWEGGKGTRDRVLMRRGDKRKYKRIGPAPVKKDKEKESK